MKKLKITRVPLTDLIDLSARPPGTELPGDENVVAGTLPDLEVDFTTLDKRVDGYGPTIPQTVKWVTVRDEAERLILDRFLGGDNNRLNALRPESIAAVRTAVIEAFDEWQFAASQQGLVTAPFGYRYALRLKDGRHITPRIPYIGDPNPVMPAILLESYGWDGLSCRLKLRIVGVAQTVFIEIMPRAENNLDGLDRAVEAIELLVTRPRDLYYKNTEITGMGTVVVDSVHERCFVLSPLPTAQEQSSAVRNEEEWYVATETPWETFIDNQDFAGVFGFPSGWLNNAALLPKVRIVKGENFVYDPANDLTPGDDDTGGDGGDTRLCSYLTPPLALGEPDRDKVVYGVALRGEYDRRHVRLRLYVSTHRRRWVEICRADAPVIRGLRLRARWFRVCIDLLRDPDDTLDALSFYRN